MAAACLCTIGPIWAAVLGLFAQLVFPDEYGLASLHFGVVGSGGSERAHGNRRDKSAGSRAKCVCDKLFLLGGCSAPGLAQIVYISAFFAGVSCRWAHWAHAGRAGLATEHLCIVGPNMCSRQLVGTACSATESTTYHMGPWVRTVRLPTAARQWYSIYILLPQNCSAQGSLPLFPLILLRCCGSW